MPRLRNELTGAVMTVDDGTAANLGSEWAPEKTDEKPTTRRKSN
jgi:hypothetical protein